MSPTGTANVLDEIVAPMARLPLLQPLTFAQTIVAAMVGQGKNYHDIAERLGICHTTVKYHAECIAGKIPGDLPAQFKIIAWYRGDDGTVLFGYKPVIAQKAGKDPIVSGEPYGGPGSDPSLVRSAPTDRGTRG